MNNLTMITGDILAAREGFQSVLAEPAMRFEREAEYALQALTASELALKTAFGNRQSVVHAITSAAAIGISLNPARKQASLVPRDGKICLDISATGLMDLSMAGGAVKWAHAELVHANDQFVRGRFDQPPAHTFNSFSRERGAVVGVYAVAKTVDGDYLTHTMDLDSDHAGRADDVLKKACVERACAYWPKSERLARAIEHLHADAVDAFTAPVRGTSEWHAARAGLMTASRFADAVGLTVKKSGARKVGAPTAAAERYAADLAIERVSGMPHGEPAKAWVLERGQTLEAAARTMYEARTGSFVSGARLCKSDCGRFGYSSDGLVDDDGLIEIKAPIDSAKIVAMIQTGDVSDYMHQIQGGMWITGRKWCDFIMYVPDLGQAGKDLYVRRIYRDDEFIGAMVGQLLRFEQMVDAAEQVLRKAVQ